MIAQIRSLIAHSPKGRLLLFGGLTVVAVLAGFILVPPATGERLIVRGGYYYISTVFAAFVIYAIKVARPHHEQFIRWLRRPGWIGAAVVGGAVFAISSDSFSHKVLFDEYVLQGTAWHLHTSKEVGTPTRAYDVAGTWVATDTFLDKRPYFFPFLLSLVHDLTGFRLQNGYILNSSLAAVTLGLLAWLVQALTGRVAASVLGVGLLATLPVFGQNATGVSMEVHNLAMIAVAMVASIIFLRAPSSDRLALLIFSAVLLAQCRYESVIFIIPVAFVIVLGWWRTKQLLLPWPAVIAPLLLVPYAWHDRYVASKPILWQLREGEAARFSWHYLQGNLEGAANFFFSVSPNQANSLALTLLGGGAMILISIRCFGRWRSRRSAKAQNDADRTSSREGQSRGAKGAVPSVPTLSTAAVVIGVFGAATAINLALLMFYYWSRLDEAIAARFALPTYFVFALLTGWFVHSLEARGRFGVWVGTAVLVGWLFVFGAPTYARRYYTEYNLAMHQLEWEIEQVTARKHPVLVITNKATIPFLLHRVSAINVAGARVRASQIAWHMQQGTFHEVLVLQLFRPTSAAGDVSLDPEYMLPDSFQLEPILRKRFGGHWIQLSRVRRIDLPHVDSITGQ